MDDLQLYAISGMDDGFTNIVVMEQYEEFVWAERYSEKSRFEMVTPDTPEMRSLCNPNMYLMLSSSEKIMRVHTVAREIDNEGVRRLKIVGESFETILEDRVASKSWEPGDWYLTNTPPEIVHQMIQEICVINSAMSPHDGYANFHSENWALGAWEIITIPVKPGTLYERIKEICDTYNMGFRLVNKNRSGQIWFQVYTGIDRTVDQTIREPVIFSPGLDNLVTPKFVKTDKGNKRVAYVKGSGGWVMPVPAPGWPESINGYIRKVLYVDGTDIEQELPEYFSRLYQRGLLELSKHKEIRAYDGAVTPNDYYVYGVDYGLGDIVQLVGDDGESSKVRVIEHVYTFNKDGVRSYPTFAEYA